MDRFVRIKSIDNFRFFESYRWNNDLKPFGKYNVVYGWNGCGKSTLSDFFAAIETTTQLPPQCSFQLCFQEDGKPEKVVTANSISMVAKRFKVYHQNYAHGLISSSNNIKHISIIGHDEGIAAARIEDLIKENVDWENKLAAAKKVGATITSNFEDYRRDRANLIRSLTGYILSYNYNKIYERYRQVKNPVEVSQEEYERLIIAVRATQKSPISIQKIQGLSKDVCEDVLSILKESPIFRAIEILQENAELRNWVQKGYEIHKDNRVCGFCNNPITAERWYDLENYFSDSLTKFKSSCLNMLHRLEEIKNQYSSYLSGLPHDTQFFDEFTAEYKTLRSNVTVLCNNYCKFISRTIELIQIKNERIIDTQCAAEYELLLSTFDFDHSHVREIASLIDKHNQKADSYAKSIEADKIKLELHIIAQSAARFIEYETQLECNAKKQREAQDKINTITTEISELDNKVKNSRIPADIINADIRFIFGHSDLKFEWKENGYEIKRNDQLASHLSTGETNAIALIYFFNTLMDSSVSKESCIVILDDPVSSFDSNHYYSAAAYIRDKLQSIGQAFILTHKFTLYKDFSRMFGDCNCNRYLLERESNSPIIREEDAFLRDYQDEYVYLFYKIYRFVKQPPVNLSDYLPYPNMGRRLLEGFISFKLPEKYTQQRDILTKAIEIDGDGNAARIRAITRLVQNQSHLRLVGAHESAENILDIKQLPNIFQHVLDFIQEHDRVHYNTLVKQVDPEGDTLITKEPQAVKSIPLFDLPVSAGFGNTIDTYEPSEPYETSNHDADFALKISGNSMEPKYPDGHIVLVKKQHEIVNAQIGIIAVNDEVFCKKVILTGDTPLLVSLNSDSYPPRKIVEDDSFSILGVVIDVEKPKKNMS